MSKIIVGLIFVLCIHDAAAIRTEVEDTDSELDVSDGTDTYMSSDFSEELLSGFELEDLMKSVAETIQSSEYKACSAPKDALKAFSAPCQTASLEVAGALARGGFGQVYVVEKEGSTEKLILKVPIPSKAVTKSCAAGAATAKCKTDAGRFVDAAAEEVTQNQMVAQLPPTSPHLDPHALEHIAKIREDFRVQVPSTPFRVDVMISEFAGVALNSIDQKLLIGSQNVQKEKRIICEGLSALTALEAAKLIHADITPANVALFGDLADPTVKIFDFGAGGPYDAYKLGKYTPGYAPPEAHLCPMGSYKEKLAIIGSPGQEHAYDAFQWGLVSIWLLTGRRVTVAKDMDGYVSDAENAPSMDFIFGMASRNYRSQVLAKTGQKVGGCYKEALDMGANVWHPFVRKDIFGMLDKAATADTAHGMTGEMLSKFKNLLLNDRDEGLLSAYPSKRQHAYEALRHPFCQ